MNYIFKDSSGTFYYKDAELIIPHREDGPAVEWADGSHEWYLNGKRHRLDGPAVDWLFGATGWCINGIWYQPKEFPIALAHWLSYKEVTQEEIRNLIGNYRIVEWL